MCNKWLYAQLFHCLLSCIHCIYILTGYSSHIRNQSELYLMGCYKTLRDNVLGEDGAPRDFVYHVFICFILSWFINYHPHRLFSMVTPQFPEAEVVIVGHCYLKILWLDSAYHNQYISANFIRIGITDVLVWINKLHLTSIIISFQNKEY